MSPLTVFVNSVYSSFHCATATGFMKCILLKVVMRTDLTDIIMTDLTDIIMSDEVNTAHSHTETEWIKRDGEIE